MFSISNPSRYIGVDLAEPLKLSSDGSNKSMFYSADVLGSKRFALNFAGYPRSDIALINEQADARLAAEMVSLLDDYSSSVNVNAGKTDAEIMLSHRSKYCQTASERISWLESQISRRDSDRAAAVAKQEIDSAGNSVENIVDKV